MKTESIKAYLKIKVGGSDNSEKSGQYSLRLNTEEITECIMKKLSEIGRASRASEVRSVLRTKEQDGTYLDPRELSGVQPKEPNQLMRINKPRGRRAVGRSPIEVTVLSGPPPENTINYGTF